jgi:hypothetical protein
VNLVKLGNYVMVLCATRYHGTSNQDFQRVDSTSMSTHLSPSGTLRCNALMNACTSDTRSAHKMDHPLKAAVRNGFNESNLPNGM